MFGGLGPVTFWKQEHIVAEEVEGVSTFTSMDLTVHKIVECQREALAST